MPLCDLCEERSEILFECKECGSKFCLNCGNPSTRICDYCQEYEDEEDGEEELSDDDLDEP